MDVGKGIDIGPKFVHIFDEVGQQVGAQVAVVSLVRPLAGTARLSLDLRLRNAATMHLCDDRMA